MDKFNATDQLYFISCIVSDVVLFLTLIASIQQFCITDAFTDKKRLRRMIRIIFNICCYLTLNTFVYISALYPHKILFANINTTTFSVLFESFTIIVAYHTYHLLVIALLDNSTSIHTPNWFKCFLNLLECLNVIAIIICYALILLKHDNIYMVTYYIILNSLFITNAIFIMILIQKPLKILNEIKDNVSDTNNKKQINSSIKFLKIGVYVSIFVCIFSLFDLMFDLELIADPFNWSVDFILIERIMHSVILIALASGLILAIYKTKYCCKMPDDSICEIWCYQLCCCGDDLDVLDDQDLESTKLVVSGNKIKHVKEQTVSTMYAIQEPLLSAN
eukprot:393984_1